jgi:hypothetical protein
VAKKSTTDSNKKIIETLAMVAKAAKASKGDLSDLREALEVFAVYHLVGPRNFALLPGLSRLQQVGYASPWLASDREFPDPLLSRQLSCNLFAVQRVSLSSGLTRSTDDMGGEA